MFPVFPKYFEYLPHIFTILKDILFEKRSNNHEGVHHENKKGIIQSIGSML